MEKGLECEKITKRNDVNHMHVGHRRWKNFMPNINFPVCQVYGQAQNDNSDEIFDD